MASTTIHYWYSQQDVDKKGIPLPYENGHVINHRHTNTWDIAEQIGKERPDLYVMILPEDKDGNRSIAIDTKPFRQR